jgi:hypothetical protein
MRYPEVKCFECGGLFPLNRPDRQFCSGRCRSKNFRRVQSEKLNLIERLFNKLPEPVNAVKHDLFA